MHFQDLLRDPVRTLSEAYGKMGREFTAEHAERIRCLLGTVPEQFRMILGLRLIQGHSYQRVADTLGIPLHSVKTAVGRGGAILYEKIRRSPDLLNDLCGEDEP